MTQIFSLATLFFLNLYPVNFVFVYDDDDYIHFDFTYVTQIQ